MTAIPVVRAAAYLFDLDGVLIDNTAADDVARGKPDPAPYVAGAQALGVAPKQCVVVEDAPSGVVAGLAAGCRVLALLTTHASEDLAGAEVQATDLSAVRLEAAPL